MSNKSLEGLTAEQIEEMAATYHAILQNPATREVGLMATKKVSPNVSIPELDLKTAARAEFTKRDEKIEKLENDIRERDARDRVNAERAALRDQGFSAADVGAIEKIMVDKQIPNYATAAEFFKNQQVVAEPTPSPGSRASTFAMPKDPLAALKGGVASLKNWAREQGTAALDDIRAGRVKLH